MSKTMSLRNHYKTAVLKRHQEAATQSQQSPTGALVATEGI
jgi:hypothetical protein